MTTARPQEVAVRIGEIEVIPGDDARALVTVGLGSCIGVALVDPRSGAISLAHVFLPEPPVTGAKPGAGPGTYASLAVPELVERVLAQAGPSARARRLVAVIAGGSQMFGGGRQGHDVGARNVEAVRAALMAAGVRIGEEDVGGGRGRTMRVWPGRDARVTVRTVGSEEREAWSLAPATPAVRTTRLAA